MDHVRRAALVLVLLLVAAGGYWGYRCYSGGDTAALEATGTIEATTLQLAAKTQGILESVAVQTGEVVSAGQVVATLARHELAAQRERDALTVAKAEAALADLQSGAREQEIKQAALAVEAAETNLAQAALDRAQADVDLERMAALREADAISAAEYEQAVKGRDTAANRVALAENQLETAQAKHSLLQSGNRPAQVEAARVEVERSRAVLRASEALLADLVIKAPRDGQVLSVNYEAGEFVTPGAAVITMADLSDMWIKVYISTDDLPQVKLGQAVACTVSGEEKVFPGIVEEIADRGEFTPKTIQTKQERANVVFGVKIRVNDPDGILKPGMPADVVFATD